MSDAGSSSGGTFFGLIVKPNKRYDTIVKEPFRVTKACLEPATAGGKVTSLYLEYDSEEFIIANLNDKTFNENLDLGFSLGEKISFKVDGPGTVHVTGNIIEDDEPSFLGGQFSGESEDEEETMETPDSVSGKRKNGELKKAAKRMKLASATSSNGKADDEESSDEDDEDEDEDSSDEETGAETTTLSDLDSTNNFAEEEDSEEESESGEEDDSEDDDESSDEDSKEETEAKQPKAKINGDVSPSKKLKPEQKTPKQAEKSKEGGKTPKSEKPANAEKTPKTTESTPKAVKTPKPDVTAKTPKADDSAKTPKASKTPKPADSVKTPKMAKTPKSEVKTPKAESNATATPKSAKKSLKGGILVEDIKIGAGPEVKPGRSIGMYYCGRLKTNNKQFDACQSGKPFKFKLGAGEVIKGWDIGILGMKVGGKRKLVLPPNMAYGPRGCPPDIPPNSTLVFDIECKFAS